MNYKVISYLSLKVNHLRSVHIVNYTPLNIWTYLNASCWCFPIYTCWVHNWWTWWRLTSCYWTVNPLIPEPLNYQNLMSQDWLDIEWKSVEIEQTLMTWRQGWDPTLLMVAVMPVLVYQLPRLSQSINQGCFLSTRTENYVRKVTTLMDSSPLGCQAPNH